VTVRQESLPPAATSRTARWVIVALAFYAVAAPLVAGIIALKLTPVPSPAFIMVGLGLVLFGPGLAAITVALRGLNAVLRDLTVRADSESQQAIIRLFIAGAVLVYVAILGFLGVAGDTILPLLAVDVPGVLTGWLLLVHVMANPEPSLARRRAAMINDITLISALLHVGGAYAAPWFSLYLWVVLGFGLRFGITALAVCAALALAGLGVVVLSTPYWQALWPVAAGIGLALALLPSYAVSLVRGLSAAKAQAEKAAETKSRFLAVMSDELRTPLNSVIGMGTLIARTKLDDEQRDMLATMQHSARMLLSIINDLLDLSQLESGKSAAPIEFFELHEVLGAAIAMVRPQAEAKGLALTLRIDPRLPPAYRGAPLQLRQVLVNLLANAIKFTPKGHIALSLTLVAQGEGKVKLALAVRDEGGGIAREDQEHIFDAFAGSEVEKKDETLGARLGLAITKHLVAAMGGTIALQSEIGKGSTFTVTLTVDQDTTGMMRAPDLLGRKMVLLSSDQDFAGLLEARLRSWHGEVQWIGDSEQAVGELALAGRSERPVVVIVDGTQDPLPGLSLAHRARTAMATPPVMLFIAPARGGEAIAGLAASQLAAVIEAPLSDTELASALLGILAADERLAKLAEGEPLAPRVSAPAATKAVPRVAPPSPSAPPAPAPAPQRVEVPSITAAKPLKILVAEDNAGNAKVLKGVLEGAGHEVEVTTDGEAALSALERTRFDIALLDINMPEVNGYEVTKLYRVGHIGEWRLPIVALTADATSETERLCREAGMDAVLVKPVEAAQLLSALDEVHGRLMRPERLAVGAPPMVVTPITAHPRFIPDSGATVDESTFDSLRNLGGNEFVFEVVDTFRKDGARIVEQLKSAAEKADIREFRDLMHSLRSGAANVGGVKLCQTLTALRDVSTKDLRASGASYVEKIESEMTRLDAILGELLQNQRR
jgi:two-component system sensor histidine kinase RpfC